jgi:predicted transcriptional regulator
MSEQKTHTTLQQKLACVLELLQGKTPLEILAQREALAPAQLGLWLETAQQAMQNALRSLTETDGEPAHGDLRDLIPRPFAAQDMIVVAPEEALSVAWQRMQASDVSQLPVMQDTRIVGMLDESDVLLHVYGDEARFADPVSAAMVARLDKVSVRAPIEALLPVFDRGHVAIVMDGEQFIGLITRIDLLDYLRRRAR